MGRQRKPVEAVAYMRTSSATNVGDDKDSERRQREAIEGFAKAVRLRDDGLVLRCCGQGLPVTPRTDRG